MPRGRQTNRSLMDLLGADFDAEVTRQRAEVSAFAPAPELELAAPRWMPTQLASELRRIMCAATWNRVASILDRYVEAIYGEAFVDDMAMIASNGQAALSARHVMRRQLADEIVRSAEARHTVRETDGPAPARGARRYGAEVAVLRYEPRRR